MRSQISRISEIASYELEEFCDKKQLRDKKNERWTESYCEKVSVLSEGNLTLTALSDIFFRDTSFLLDRVKFFERGGRTGYVISQTAEEVLILQLMVNDSVSIPNKNYYAWIGLLLAPIGFGLRLSKTTIELLQIRNP